MNIQEYIHAINEQFQTGIAREHSYRPALQQLLSDMLPNHVVTNEPAHIECGAPDYIISQSRGAKQPVFFVEAKDLFDSDLDGMRQHKEQFMRYKSSLDYIIFTDYLDFHVYEHGEWVKNVRIGEQQGQRIRPIQNAEDEFTAIIQHLANSRPTPITSASRLAQQMASKARLLADVVTKAFENGMNENDPHYHDNEQLEGQLRAFRNILIHDLTPEGFADIYAQTVAYGMFAARLHDDTPEDFSRQEASTLIPKTNPFLRQIFQQIAGYDLDERIAWIVDDLAQTFLVTDVERVMRSYGGNQLHSDPMIHFYEDFLSAYDPRLRKAKGVWYTPQPVVQFIVRAVDEILQRDFNLPMGLADDSKIDHEVKNDHWDGRRATNRTIRKKVHRVQILDPATGTGTFLAEVVRQIYAKFQGVQGMWQGYVEDHLLPRLHGFELLMASYAVAHLKLDMQLRAMGYDSSRTHDRRLGVYLTNSLEEHHPDTGTLWSQWLSREADQANYIKRDCPVMVMVGNPPYNNSSTNNNPWILNKIRDYKQGLNERKLNLDDDYVKFIRLAQDYIERNGQGIVAFITNNNFIDAVTFRQMRKSLLDTFDDIYIVNLHGNTRKKERSLDGSKDENVFDIMQGVSINIFVRRTDHVNGKLGNVFYKELYGRREFKYDYLEEKSLVNDVEWEKLSIVAPNFFFVPKDFRQIEDYELCVKVNDLFSIYNSGIQSKRDNLNIFFSENDRINILNDFKNLANEEIAKKYSVTDTSGWNIASAKRDLCVNPILTTTIDYRPFDKRYTNYTGVSSGMMGRPRFDTLRHLLKENLGLCCIRLNNRNEETYYITNTIVDKTLLSSKDDISVFPLYLYTTAIDGTEERVPNLKREEWQKFNDAVGREVSPEELLHYIYGVLHSPSYRERYKEFLKIDFPRIPLPETSEEFNRKASYGSQLIELHLMRNANTWQLDAQYNISGSNTVEILRYDDGNVWINEEQYFGNVSATAWNAHIGGYQPAQKWLKDRRGRTLSFDDIRHYLRIIHALTETQRIMNEIG